MISLALYFLAAFGLAYIVGHSAISMPVRLLIGGPEGQPRAYLGFLVALLECPACFGTWTGLAVGAFLPGLFLQSSSLAGAFVAACATAGFNFILGKATGLVPVEPDPMREQLAAMIMAQMQPRPDVRWYDGAGSIQSTNLSQAGELGQAVMDEEGLRWLRLRREADEQLLADLEAAKDDPAAQSELVADHNALFSTMDRSRKMRAGADGVLRPDSADLKYPIPVSLEDLRNVLSPLQYFASGDAHENEVRADSLEALTVFDAKYPGVLVADPEQDEDVDWDTDLRVNANAPEDTPENWAKYREAQDFAEKLAEERMMLITNAHRTGKFPDDYNHHLRAADFNLRVARENAGKARPKDPMQTHALTDAAPVDDITPEDIAAFQSLKPATPDATPDEWNALKSTEEEF